METLTKTADQMSEGFAQPDMQERFSSWAERVGKEARQEEKKNEYHPRELSARDLKDRPDAERDWIEKVGQKTEAEKESPAKSAAEKDSRKPAEGSKPDTKAGEKSASESTNSPVEPIAADMAERHWQGKLQRAEVEPHLRQVDARAGVALQYINSHPQKEQIAQGLQGFFTGRPPAEAQGFFRDFSVALAEVPNPGEVLRHIALKPEDREFVRNVKNWKELRTAIQTISKHYAPTSQASPKPRAPKPPTEVGGRGAAGDDGTRGEMNFGDFDRKMRETYARRYKKF